MREVIATGKTVEEATENGCAELGLGRDEVSVEILEMPVSKLFKKTLAKVKVSADADAAPAPEAEKPAGQAAAPAKPQPQQPAAGPAAQSQAKPQARPAPAAPVLPEEPEEEIDLDQNEMAKTAADYLLSIFEAMGAMPVSLTALRQGDATLFRIEGESIADKLEVRGEVIQALSYLVDRAVNTGVDKKDAEYLRVRLDIAGYRNRREGELIALANRTGKEVARTGRSRTLAPMNPYERLIVHTTISKIEGITSESTGADTERRVVVKSLAANATDGGDWRPPRKGGGHGGRGGGGRGRDDRRDRGDRGDRGGDRRRGGGGGGNRSGGGGYGGGGYGGGQRPSSAPEREYADKPKDPNAAPVVPEHREAIKDGEDLPLYGKIEL